MRPPRGGATYWYLSGQPSEGVRTNALKRFNEANPNDQIQGTTFQNDAYKTRIRTAVGAEPGAHHHLGLGRRHACAATCRRARSRT